MHCIRIIYRNSPAFTIHGISTGSFVWKGENQYAHMLFSMHADVFLIFSPKIVFLSNVSAPKK